ncbi:MAG: YbfB/YjiJ family MFS transporter [Dehalococcoidia bacterium]|nr:YbfB/YjiJ family MFS transporter [Dehalococcoidia bacterium]
MSSREATSADPFTAVSSNYHWVIVGTNFILLLAAMGFGRYAYPMLLPSMQAGLGVTYAPMGVLGTVNLVGYLSFALISGILATRYGAKLIITVSMLLIGVSMVALGFVSTYWLAFVAMIFAGIGTAGVFTPGSGLSRAWAPPNRIGITMGALSTGVGAGILIAAGVIPLILTSQGADGWRHAWVYLGITTVLLTILGVVALKEKATGHGQGQERASGPVLAWDQVFRNRTVIGLTVTYFLFGFFQIYATFFVAYLRGPAKLSTAEAGNIWLAWAVVGVAFMAFWGWLSDRIGRREAMTPCIIFLAASVLMPIFWQDVPLLYVSAMLFGATFTGPMTIILASAGEAVAPRLAPAAMGLVTAGFGLGQAVSPAMAGQFADITGSFYPGFVLSSVVMLASLVTFLLLPLKTHAR